VSTKRKKCSHPINISKERIGKDMNTWDKLLNVQIENKERFQKLFAKTIKEIQENMFFLNIGETEKEDYYLVVEENRMQGYFVHIVPKQVYLLFKTMQKKIPDQFLGFSVVAGRHNNKDIRVSCFGVDCSSLGNALTKKDSNPVK